MSKPLLQKEEITDYEKPNNFCNKGLKYIAKAKEVAKKTEWDENK